MSEKLHTRTSFLFSIHDIKTNTYDIPFPAPSKLDAIRSLEMEIKRSPTSTIASFPQDYQLVCIGTWDDNAHLDTYKIPEILASAAQFSATQQG